MSAIRARRLERRENRKTHFYHNNCNVYAGKKTAPVDTNAALSLKEYYPSNNVIKSQKSTKNFYKFLSSREVHEGSSCIFGEIGTRRMIQHKLFKERVLPLETNKVFCSKWLSDSNIALGTKCNKILIYNVQSHKAFEIPTLKISTMSQHMTEQCGIHSIKTNPSKDLLVTGGPHSNDISVYRLPSLKPLCVGETAHKDWVFDLEWLDDKWFVSGGRDGNIGLWNITLCGDSPSDNLPYYYIKPVCVERCRYADKVRALHFQPLHKLTALSTNSILHVWDLTRFQQVSSRRLPHRNENVCLAYNSRGIYAVGSYSHVTFCDSSTSLPVIQKIKTDGQGVRSLSFHGDILTIGTGSGKIQFYDLVAGKMFEQSDCNISYATDIQNRPIAIYTHCYNSSGTSMFVGGGPLSMLENGCYAALWE